MEFVVSENAVTYQGESGAVLAEVTFPAVAPGVVAIDHTFVDPSLRGQGMAGQLLERAANAIAASGRKAKPVCSYAVSWFEKHPERSELLA